MSVTPAALFLKDLAILFGVAALATVVFERLRLPIIAGYLVAGIVLGPHVGPALITDAATVRVLAEVGVVLILGSVGLEFRLRRLLQLGPRVGLTAIIEVGFMLAVGIGLATAMGWGRLDRLLAGGIVAISSTAVIAKVFEERTVDRSLKDLVFGVLVMEDLVAVVLIAVAAAAALGSGLDVRSIGDVLLRMGGTLLAILVAGLLLVPRMIRAVVRLGRSETTLITAVGLTFLVAVITETAGYSVALGAFLAGLLMAESGMGHQIAEVMKPVRDLFAAVFFVAAGMLLDVGAAVAAWPLVLGFTAVVVLGKISSVSVGAFLNGFGARNSIRAGLSLAQIGEFSFILAGLGGSQSVGAAPLYSIAVATAMITSFLTPWLVGRSDRAAAWIDRRLPAPLQTFSSLYGAWLEASAERRATGGPGRTAKQQVRLIVVDATLVAAILIGTSIAYRRGVPWLDRLALAPAVARLVVPIAGIVVALPFGFGLMLAIRRLARLLGEAAVPPVAAGKVDQGLAPRQLFVITVEIAVVIAVGIPLVVVTLPFLPPLGAPGVVAALLLLLGVSFWRTARTLDSHARAGAELVVHVLGKQAIHGDTGQFAVVRGMLPGMGDLAPFVVEPGSPLDGKTLGELDVRGRTGATVVAIARGRERFPFPRASARVQAGDLVAVTGTHDAVSQAEALGRATDTTTRPSDRDSSALRAARGSEGGEAGASGTPPESPGERRDR